MGFTRTTPFWDRVEKTDGCWPWKGAKVSGYGKITITGRIWRAHRRAWFLVNGPIPPALDVLHHCDNRPCCRPDHLFLGTNADNIADRVAKGRSPRGDSHWSRRHPEKMARGEAVGGAKLTAAQVSEIRSRHAEGEASYSLGPRFGVSPRTIRDITSGKLWKHVHLTARTASPIESTAS